MEVGFAHAEASAAGRETPEKAERGLFYAADSRPPVRKGLFIIGIVVTVIGAILLAAAALGLQGYNSVQPTPIPGAPGFLQLSISTIGNAQLAISWTGGTNATQVQIFSCPSACQLTGAPLASGNGASGTLSVSVPPGVYAVTQPSGSGTVGQALSGQYEVSGITFLLLIGIVLLAVGVLLWVRGALAKGKEKPASEAEAEPEAFSLRSSLGSEEAAAAPMAAPVTGTRGAAVPTVSYRAEAPAPPRYATSDAPTPAGSPMAGYAKTRQNVKCARCGTMNEPWITNCRNCKRPLSTTG